LEEERVSSIRTREAAEVERSEIEAARTSGERLATDIDEMRRYLDPPPATPYPLEYAFRLVGDVRRKVVLDYGCGSGENCVPLVMRDARVIGLDVSQALLRLARERLRRVGLEERARFVAASGHELPLPDGSVDAVLGIAILHHLAIEPAAQEIRRVLRPGGVAVFQEPIRNSAVLRAVRAAIPYRDPEVSDDERPLVDADLRVFHRLFSRYHERNFSLPFVNLANVVPSLRRHIKALYRVDGALLRRAPWLEGFAGIRVFAVTK
jgi:ubiquinone/menaquinone biosynthesis C-methylase UbiE